MKRKMVTEEEVLDTLQGQDEFEDEAMDYLPVVEEKLEEDLGKTWSFGNSLRLEKVAVDKFILFILKGSGWEILLRKHTECVPHAHIDRFIKREHVFVYRRPSAARLRWL